MPPVETKPLPEIPMADSGWVGGGSSPGGFCGPVFEVLKLKYPDFVVSMQLLPEQHRSEYTPFKHDYYRYTCSFSVATKS
jgi:hypothetical protein